MVENNKNRYYIFAELFFLLFFPLCVSTFCLCRRDDGPQAAVVDAVVVIEGAVGGAVEGTGNNGLALARRAVEEVSRPDICQHTAHAHTLPEGRVPLSVARTAVGARTRQIAC